MDIHDIEWIDFSIVGVFLAFSDLEVCDTKVEFFDDQIQ